MNHSNPGVVICGAGVIGAAVAYYLSLRGVAVTIVERCGVACAASGKAGGFLALDWCDGSPLRRLARQSFELHAQLATSLGVDYGYRRLTTLAVAASATEAPPQTDNAPSWLDGNCAVYSVLGTPATTAQVHPEQFTQALLQSAIEHGARLLLGRVDGLELVGSLMEVGGVRVDGQIVPSEAVVIAMGPWSGVAAQWLPLPPVVGLKGHSITLRPSTPIPAQALFVDYETESGERLSSEVYPRPDGELYLCGLSDSSTVPEHPNRVRPRPEAGAMLRRIAGDLSSSLTERQPCRVQACFRPFYEDGLPLLGKVPGVKNAYIATGHSCWGILNAPASGAALAELIVDGSAETVDLSPFDPQRALATAALPY